MILNNFYRPYAHLACYSPSYVHNGDGSRGYQDCESLRRQRQRAEVVAAQRARRAQYLPPEDVDGQEEYSFGPFGPHERAYLDADRIAVAERSGIFHASYNQMRRMFETRHPALYLMAC